MNAVAAPEEGDKAPLSRGWAYGGQSGSRKEEVATASEEGEKAVRVSSMPLKDLGGSPASAVKVAAEAASP